VDRVGSLYIHSELTKGPTNNKQAGNKAVICKRAYCLNSQPAYTKNDGQNWFSLRPKFPNLLTSFSDKIRKLLILADSCLNKCSWV